MVRPNHCSADMSDNSSNHSFPQPHTFSNLFHMNCFFFWPSNLIQGIYNVLNIVLLLPLCTFILHHGFQQWRNKSSSMSHSNVFTYNMVLIELVGLLARFLGVLVVIIKEPRVFLVMVLVSMFNWVGQVWFHLLTCVERYLAVVHPVIYMRLRGKRGTLIRNVTVGCVWMLCLAEMGFVFLEDLISYKNFCFLTFSIVGVIFCSLSVLRVLIRPSPGEQGKKKEKSDQSKRRAFYTIMAILVVLLVKFTGNMLWGFFIRFEGREYCVVMISVGWIDLPSYLILPLLFLIRQRK